MAIEFSIFLKQEVIKKYIFISITDGTLFPYFFFFPFFFSFLPESSSSSPPMNLLRFLPVGVLEYQIWYASSSALYTGSHFAKWGRNSTACKGRIFCWTTLLSVRVCSTAWTILPAVYPSDIFVKEDKSNLSDHLYHSK